MEQKVSERIKFFIAVGLLCGLCILASILLFYCPIGGNPSTVYLGIAMPIFLIGLICLIVFLLCVACTLLAILTIFFLKRKRRLFLTLAAVVDLVGVLSVCIVSLLFHFRAAPFIFIALGLLLFAAVMVFIAKQVPESGEADSAPVSIASVKASIRSSGQTSRSIIVVCVTLLAGLAGSIVIAAMPLYLDAAGKSHSFSGILANFAAYALFEQILCIAFFMMLFLDSIFLIHLVTRFFTGTRRFLTAARRFMLFNIAIALFAMSVSIVMMFIAKFQGANTLFVTYINVLIAYAVYAVFVCFSGRAKEQEQAKREKRAYMPKKRKASIMEMIFLGSISLITFMMLFVPMYTMRIDHMGLTVTDIGWDILLNASVQNGFQNVLAMVLLLFCMLSMLFFIFTLINFIVDAETYRQSAFLFAYTNLFFQFSYLTFGLFYVLTVPSFDNLVAMVFGDNINWLIDSGLKASNYIKASTIAYIPFLIGFVLLICMQFYCSGRRRAGLDGAIVIEDGELTVKPQEADSAEPEADEPDAAPGVPNGPIEAILTAGADLESETFDPCPTFSYIDAQMDEFRAHYEALQKTAFDSITLKDLTRFVVYFARNTQERLSYTPDAIATFIAGLGASRLSILQGMSGTGKTSLPKAFMQAIGGACNIVEVESSWRDKNELLGYYNEFNGVYSPKKFTQFLYRAVLNKNVPTFIVLDEMNLSRIEYYFSDFLSLMESRENERFINLLYKRIYPPAPPALAEDEGAADASDASDAAPATPVAPQYLALINGNTIQVPPNVWFIGTANRDESTFEISDKVYDRAQTINFDSRAPKVTAKHTPIAPRFVGYDRLATLFQEAKSSFEFDAERNESILAVEKILLPYKISFGNRILKQIEDFVKVYAACFDTDTPEKMAAVLHRAIENIMYSKVLRKLELKIVDNKPQLANSFENLGFKTCADFIRRLEDN